MIMNKKIVDELFQELTQKQACEAMRKGALKLDYYTNYPFLERNFYYESKLIPELPTEWYLIRSFDEFEILVIMYEELYNTDETPNLTQEYGGWGTYGIAFDDEFCALKIYKLDDYVHEILQMREKMSDLFAKLSD